MPKQAILVGGPWNGRRINVPQPPAKGYDRVLTIPKNQPPPNVGPPLPARTLGVTISTDLATYEFLSDDGQRVKYRMVGGTPVR